MNQPDVTAAIAVLEAAVREALAIDLPDLLGELERLRAVGWARIPASRPVAEKNGAGERLLTAEDVSARTTVSVAWLYRHAGALPFTRRIGRKVLFSEAGLTKWLATRAP